MSPPQGCAALRWSPARSKPCQGARPAQDRAAFPRDGGRSLKFCGYAAHSVSPSQLEAVDQYVANQEAHHTRMTFQEDLRIICRKNGIELDERFAWD